MLKIFGNLGIGHFIGYWKLDIGYWILGIVPRQVGESPEGRNIRYWKF